MRNLVYCIPCLNCDKVYRRNKSHERKKWLSTELKKTFASDSKIVEPIEDRKCSFEFTRMKTPILKHLAKGNNKRKSSN